MAGGCLPEGYGTGRARRQRPGLGTRHSRAGLPVCWEVAETHGQRAGFGERKPVHRTTGWSWLGSALPTRWDRARSAPTPTRMGEGTPPASLIFLPGGANPKGMRSRLPVVAASQRFPITTPHSWTWSNTTGDASTRGSSLRLGVGASISQPCSDSILYFGNWQIPSVAPAVL